MDVNNSVAVSSGVQKLTGMDGNAQTEKVRQAGSAEQNPESPRYTVEPTEKADPKAVQDAVEKLSEFVETVSNRGLQISIDKDLSQVVLKVVNKDNEETIRQIPTEEVLELMKRMKDLSEEFFGDATGLLVESKV
ncbi:flagellar protein FlaG [Marinobacterium sp. BA1]|uniref:flagellar protein FlaG n=1 Tax=Marinobacterium sp. BA1 TaxID=3138931 RepID=UPI0032E6744C